MNSEKIFLVDPYDEDHINLIKKFEQEHNIETLTSTYIKDLTYKTREEYKEALHLANDIVASLFTTTSNTIKDLCFIKGEKDIKTCTLFFAQIKTQPKRKIINYATDYAINTLGMKEIFVKEKSPNKSYISYLEYLGYESLGIENDEEIFLKESPEITNNQRKTI